MSAKTDESEGIPPSSQEVRRSDRIKSKSESTAELRSPISQIFFPPVQFSTRTQYMEHVKAAHKVLEEAENVEEGQDNCVLFDEYIHKLYDMYVDLSNPPKYLRAKDSAEASALLINIRSRTIELSRQKKELLHLGTMLERTSPTSTRVTEAPSQPGPSKTSRFKSSSQLPVRNSEASKLFKRNADESRELSTQLAVTSISSESNPDTIFEQTFGTCESVVETERICVQQTANFHDTKLFIKGPSSSGILEYRTPRRRQMKLSPTMAGQPHHYSLFRSFNNTFTTTNMSNIIHPNNYKNQKRRFCPSKRPVPIHRGTQTVFNTLRQPPNWYNFRGYNCWSRHWVNSNGFGKRR